MERHPGSFAWVAVCAALLMPASAWAQTNLTVDDVIAVSLVGQTIPAGSSTHTFNVLVNGDTTAEPNETFFVNVTNVTGADRHRRPGPGHDQQRRRDAHADPRHPGPGRQLAARAAQSVTTRGIVTGVQATASSSRSPTPRSTPTRRPPRASCVHQRAPPAAAAVGNLVQVTGTVAEFVPSADPLQPPLTELTSPTTSQLSLGQPAAGARSRSPRRSPTPPASRPARAARGDARLASPRSRSSGRRSATSNEANATATSSGVFYGVVTGRPRPFREAGIQAPDPAPSGGGRSRRSRASTPTPRRIRVDSDGLVGGPLIDVGTGAVVTGLVGPLDYTFRTYTILPDAGGCDRRLGGPTPGAVTAPTRAGVHCRAPTTCERFFDTVTIPASATSCSPPRRSTTACQGLARDPRLPAHARHPRRRRDGEPHHAAGARDPHQRRRRRRRAARPAVRAVPRRRQRRRRHRRRLPGEDGAGRRRDAACRRSTPWCRSTPATLFVNPDTSTELLNDRPPLRLDAVVNHANGASFPLTVIVNHLRSLDARQQRSAAGTNGWPTTGAGSAPSGRSRPSPSPTWSRRARSPTRRAHRPARRLQRLRVQRRPGRLDGRIAGTPPPDNETAVPGDGIDLVNPDLDNLFDTPPPAERYSYVFDGNAQNLDHALVNAPLIAATLARRLEHARINADFAETRPQRPRSRRGGSPTTTRSSPTSRSRPSPPPTSRSTRRIPGPGDRGDQPDLHDHGRQRRPRSARRGHRERHVAGRHHLRLALLPGGWTAPRRRSAPAVRSPARSPRSRRAARCSR